ncbi:MAG: TonB-dependent receptor [Bacteroidota bacterium]
MLDAATGDPLPGVNVVIEGTTQGASTDLEGFYTILNVRPGSYVLDFSFIGFATLVVEDVDVDFNRTTTIDVELREEAAGLDEVVVRAERPPVQLDVSNSRVNVTAEEIESLPLQSIEGIVTLQAGVEDGLQIRGQSRQSVGVFLNGFMMRNPRDNEPLLSVPVAAVGEVQVQKGGFSAEYGGVRAGVVNYLTREGDPNRYNGYARVIYSPPAQKNFGGSPNDFDSYWIRPFLDPDVAFTGTNNGAWDEATRALYREFEGWIAVSEQRLRDDDPTNDMTPEALQQAFLYQHRKNFEITEPDVNVDVGFGGPVPGISEQLGDLRFWASYRQNTSQYAIPMQTDALVERTGHFKLTSNVARGMKLSVEGLYGNKDGTLASRSGLSDTFGEIDGTRLFLFDRQRDVGAAFSGTSEEFLNARLFATDYYNPTETQFNMVGVSFSHNLSNTSFYEVRANRLAYRHDTFLGAPRDTTTQVEFGGVAFDESPFGYFPEPTFGVNEFRTSVGFSNARDTSRVAIYNLRADYTNQLSPVVEVKTGALLTVTDFDINYGRFDEFLPELNSISQYNATPWELGLYAQTTLEFKGLVANLGLRGEFLNTGTEGFAGGTYDNILGTRADIASGPTIPDSLLADPGTFFALSPRLGVSFPITEVSKLFFNYGHFRSLPSSPNLYLYEFSTATGRITELPNPDMPLPKTVAYELGYEQSFLGQYSAAITGYYRDVRFEPLDVEFVSRNGNVEYDLVTPNFYQDTRGFELTLAKSQGNWVRGFVNWTFAVDTDGFFGLSQISENTTAQRAFEAGDGPRRAAQSRPVADSFGSANINVFTPEDFGPSYSGFHPLGGWRSSLIGRWRDGGKITWGDGSFNAPPGVINNVDVRDAWQIDLRFERTFNIRGQEVGFFADILNLTNRRQFSNLGYIDGNDRINYVNSLHLPESDIYSNIPGDDQFGDFPDEGVAFQPIFRLPSTRDAFLVTNTPDPGTIYWERGTESYLVFVDGDWQPVDQARLDEVLDTKAYIDMPGQRFLAFLGRRDFFFGLRFEF